MRLADHVRRGAEVEGRAEQSGAEPSRVEQSRAEVRLRVCDEGTWMNEAVRIRWWQLLPLGTVISSWI